MLCFKNAKVDWSIYEVGLGGRLDSTNVINPVCSVINTIELEHTEFLGNSLEQIAFEKGGIIKKDTPVFIANQNQNVKDVFKKIAQEKNSPIYFLDDYCILLEKSYCNERLKIKFESKLFERPISANLKMLGDFQVQNAMLASMCVKSILPEIPLEIIEAGLENASLEGRFEIHDDLKKYPSLKKIIFDGAHTVKSIQSTIDTLNDIFSTEEKKNLLFACASDKNVTEIAKTFKNKFTNVFITIPGKTKESDISSVTKAFDELGIKYISSLDYEKMINFALDKSNEDNVILLVTGSFYLISEVKKILNANLI
jgi:dihydrofolate synthase/folylpolyglutamate synthase